MFSWFKRFRRGSSAPDVQPVLELVPPPEAEPMPEPIPSGTWVATDSPDVVLHIEPPLEPEYVDVPNPEPVTERIDKITSRFVPEFQVNPDGSWLVRIYHRREGLMFVQEGQVNLKAAGRREALAVIDAHLERLKAHGAAE